MAVTKKSKASKTISRSEATRIAKADLLSLNAAPTLKYAQRKSGERPTGYNEVIKLCRQLAGIQPPSLINSSLQGASFFLTSYYQLLFSFFNSGLTFVSKGKPEALEKSLAETMNWQATYVDPTSKLTIEAEFLVTREEATRNFIGDLIKEFLILDSSIVFWQDALAIPMLLAHEKCVFQDTFGVPVLKYTHGLTSQEIENIEDASVKARFKKYPTLLIDAKEGEHFKVLKRAKLGDGLGMPKLASLFKLMGELDSKEEFMHSQAYLLRKSPRQHKLGHKIESGDHAGRGTWMWSKKRDIEARAQFGNQEGPFEMTSNFDHEIVYPCPELARFDETLWKGSNMRAVQWGGPAAKMLIDKVDENLLSILRTMVNEDRKKIATFLQPILPALFGFKDTDLVRPVWSDEAFIDPVRAADLIKFAVQQGLSSNETTRSRLGLPPGEDLRKLTESQDKDAVAKNSPLFDSSHDTNPALRTAADINGKPELANKAAKAASKTKPAGDTGRPPGVKTGAGK